MKNWWHLFRSGATVNSDDCFYFHSIQDMDKRLQALMSACEKLPTDNLNNFRSVAFPNFPGSTSTEKDWEATKDCWTSHWLVRLAEKPRRNSPITELWTAESSMQIHPKTEHPDNNVRLMKPAHQFQPNTCHLQGKKVVWNTDTCRRRIRLKSLKLHPHFSRLRLFLPPNENENHARREDRK